LREKNEKYEHGGKLKFKINIVFYKFVIFREVLLSIIKITNYHFTLNMY